MFIFFFLSSNYLIVLKTGSGRLVPRFDEDLDTQQVRFLELIQLHLKFGQFQLN